VAGVYHARAIEEAAFAPEKVDEKWPEEGLRYRRLPRM